MSLSREQVIEIVFPQSDAVRGRRFTQDTPVLVDVWVAFGSHPGSEQELLLSPHRGSSVRELVAPLRRRLARERGLDPKEAVEGVPVIFNESHALVRITYRELLRVVLPLSAWWHREIREPGQISADFLATLAERENFVELLLEPARQDARGEFSEDLLNLIRIAGAVALSRPLPQPEGRAAYLRDALGALAELMRDLSLDDRPPTPPLGKVFCNRTAHSAVTRSRLAVKADAAVRLFEIRCQGIRWAVIDSGIDARHPAFRRQPAIDARAVQADCVPAEADASRRSRILKTYDFTRLRGLLYSGFEIDRGQRPPDFSSLDDRQWEEIRKDLRRRLQTGQPLDWNLLGPLLQVSHDKSYQSPVNEHGTHVAGILAADWRKPKPDEPKSETRVPDEGLFGICPDLELYDLRVIEPDGTGNEFSILAALQFVRHLNLNKDRMVLHGVNLSFSLPHAVDSFACGSTPVCEECDRLVGSGVVVVAAAGNRGCRSGTGAGFEDYQNISITDPGNAEEVITVGATHRFMPHKYGVSYFSSRGPTGDGRPKPDLVAPGEKIESTIPGGKWVTLDGTSMAAPHVSGAAALLMARHRELMGDPERIKQVLCRTATDLGRDRSFQGAGMLDVLRALQSV